MLDSNQEIRTYKKDNEIINVFRGLYQRIIEAYDDRSEFEKDIWDLRKLGIKPGAGTRYYHLNFDRLKLVWLRESTKTFIRYQLSKYTNATAQNYISAINLFSDFLVQEYPQISPSQIDRKTILGFFEYLVITGYSEGTRHGYIGKLKVFLELCAREGWMDITSSPLIYKEDFPKIPLRQPRFIPEYIMQQLNNNLDALRPDIMRMILILQECGMRISELLMLPPDCITHDQDGDWFLRTYQSKLKKEHTVPISSELVRVIREQQKHVLETWGDSAEYLFPTPKGKPILYKTFMDNLNRMAKERNICDESGMLFHFQAHEFRHTVGTRMINLGIPQHIVQRFLGHETPRMTSVYTHIHDQTLKTEFMKFKGKLVDVTGATLLEKDDVNSSDLQWLKKNILAQALPNGYCSLPIVAGSCPHANACLTCTHFRTDESFLPLHEKQIIETEKLLQVARANSWTRQIETNEQVLDNLCRIRDSLLSKEVDPE